MKKVSYHLKRKLKDPYFRGLYEFEKQKAEIAKVLIDYRIKHNLTQKELAEQIGITQQHISKIENGEFSKLKTVELILLLLGFKIKFDIEPLSKQVRKKVSLSSIKKKLRKELVST